MKPFTINGFKRKVMMPAGSQEKASIWRLFLFDLFEVRLYYLIITSICQLILKIKCSW